MEADSKLNDLLEKSRIDRDSTGTVSFHQLKKPLMLYLKVTSELAPSFVSEIGADKVEFIFKKPNGFRPVGSYSTRCMAKPDASVDLLLHLPKECFHEKDYMNHLYHAKRCLYLCVLKNHLLLSSSVEKVEWSALQNEARKPVLVVFPAKKVDHLPGFSIRIIPSAKSLFDVAMLSMSSNNLPSVTADGDSLPTPTYNLSILEDMFLEENSNLLENRLSQWKALPDALILLKIWARQRSSIYAHDCLNGFLIFVIVSFLARFGYIEKSQNALQIFTKTLEFITTHDFEGSGLFFTAGKTKILASTEENKKFKELFPVLICDPSTHVNLAFRMTSIGLHELRHEASSTLTRMKLSDGGFEEAFMTKIDYPVKYDHCIRLHLEGKIAEPTSVFCLDKEYWRIYEQKVHSLLEQGLGDRAKSIRVVWRNANQGSYVEDGLSVLDREPLFIGISIRSTENAFRMVDIGPDADNKEEVLKFRKFGGDKSELRRLEDGRIAECTVWETQQWRRHLIMKQMIEYIFERHLSLYSDDIVQLVDQLDFSLLYGDKALRLTSVFPPEPHPLVCVKIVERRLHEHMPSCIPTMEVMIQLEGPGDLEIEKTKTDFLLQIVKKLQKVKGITRPATENNVVFMGGYAFRLSILHETGFPTYAPVARLAKRWVSAHLFSGCLAEEAIELLVAHVFLTPLPLGVPLSRFSGFLRFLRLLADYDWWSCPLIVDRNSDFGINDHKDINDNFMSSRKRDEEGRQNISSAMFLAAPYDKASEAWTTFSPNLSEQKRLVASARSSANVLSKLVLQEHNDSVQWESLFRPPLDKYDAVVLLHRENLPYPRRLLFPPKLNQGPKGDHVARWEASTYVNRFLLPGYLERSHEQLKEELMLDSDPTKCFLSVLEASFLIQNRNIKTYRGSYRALLSAETVWDVVEAVKRKRDEDETDPKEILKAVGEMGKGLVRDILVAQVSMTFLKA
ncbi:hypothetical protein HID58_020474 [Brassica napus]|uniref:Nucleolar protein 6 n=1 Tax=Brassica napus TaxID=3708 RepID=A0ABQ7XGQ9_BRANA|nr:hypothetical protein HID58_020474 [Brassica napus]